MYVYIVLERNNIRDPKVTRIAAVFSTRDAAANFIKTFDTLVHSYEYKRCKVDSINYLED